MVLSTLFVQAGATRPVNGIEQICRCPGDTVKCLQILNDAVYDNDMHVTSSYVG